MSSKPAKAPARLSEARRERILELAWSAFLELGYNGASMAEIADRVGGSKATLYNYFPSKEVLFRAVIARRGSQLYSKLNAMPFEVENLAGGLVQFGMRLLRVVLSDEYVIVHRLVISECGRFPDLGEVDIEARRRAVLEPLRQCIETQMQNGRLRPGDPLDASEAFWNLCSGTVHRLALMTTKLRLDEARIRSIAERATTIFLAAYNPETEAGPRGSA